MSEFRRNPFTGEWTVYAKNRKNKPYEFHFGENQKIGVGTCPFCPGHETRTTPAIYEKIADGKWQIRVFGNKFPIVQRQDTEDIEEGFYEGVAGIGRHEVMVDTPNHTETIEQFSEQRMLWILEALRLRYTDLLKDETTRHVQIFKNCGARAGMSIYHSHWQMVGIPILPERIRRMAERSMTTECLFCRMIQWEKEQDKRIAGENKSFLAVTPYASRYPYELWILPKTHRKNYIALTEEEMGDLAELLHILLPKVAGLRQDTAYNLCFMDAPKGLDFHWHLQILPRIGGFAGFEHATDCYINTILPEEAADYYQGKSDT